MKFIKYFTFVSILSVFMNMAFTGNAAAADAANGKKLFTKCKACHNVDAPKNKVGPHLVGIVGRPAASADGYTKYSKDLKDSGIKWDEANLDKWLTNPKGMYPGTKMIYPGLKDAAKRADLIEYLKTK